MSTGRVLPSIYAHMGNRWATDHPSASDPAAMSIRIYLCPPGRREVVAACSGARLTGWARANQSSYPPTRERRSCWRSTWSREWRPSSGQRDEKGERDLDAEVDHEFGVRAPAGPGARRTARAVPRREHGVALRAAIASSYSPQADGHAVVGLALLHPRGVGGSGAPTAWAACSHGRVDSDSGSPCCWSARDELEAGRRRPLRLLVLADRLEDL